MRYRITIRGVDIELRGYVDGQANLAIIAQTVDPLGLMVVASDAEDDFNPFQVEDGPELSIQTIIMMIQGNGIDNLPDLIMHMAQTHYLQAQVIQGERREKEQAQAELREAEALNQQLVAEKEDLLRKYRQREEFIRNLRDDIKGFRVQLASPPPGWYTLGTHGHAETPMEFWGDDAGVPFWERPKEGS